MSKLWKKYVWNTRPIQCPLNIARSYIQPLWNDEFNASQITDYIWLSGFASACNKDELDTRGIKNVVEVIYGPGEQHPNQGITYLLVPVIDDPRVNISIYFDKAADFINKCVQKEESVLIHCVAGKSRSVTIVASYLIKYKNMSATEAIEFLKDKRDVCNPNPGFAQQLENYAEKLTKTDTTPTPIYDNLRSCPNCGKFRIFTDNHSKNPLFRCDACVNTWHENNNNNLAKFTQRYPCYTKL